MKKIAVSTCLLGENVRYDGTNKRNNELLDILNNKVEIISICPEILAGLPTPRSTYEITGDKVFSINKEDYTDMFYSGANIALAKIKECDFVILKSKSPSCGYKKIYDGTFSNKLIEGNGIFTRLCIENKIKVFSEEDLDLIRELIK